MLLQGGTTGIQAPLQLSEDRAVHPSIRLIVGHRLPARLSVAVAVELVWVAAGDGVGDARRREKGTVAAAAGAVVVLAALVGQAW